MNMPMLKAEAGAAVPMRGATAEAKVGKLKTAQVGLFACVQQALSTAAASVLPPLVTLAILLAVWQGLCDRPGATLPAPTKIWAEARDLIMEPFFVAGLQDIGLGWRVITSLQRVAIGYGLAG